jgi:hypothetical protein
MPGLRVLRLFGRQLELVGHSAELGKRTSVHLPHRPAAVDLHLASAIPISPAICLLRRPRDLNHDLALPRAQRLEAVPEVGQRLFILTPGAIAREAELNGVGEVLIPETVRSGSSFIF